MPAAVLVLSIVDVRTLWSVGLIPVIRYMYSWLSSVFDSMICVVSYD